MITLNDCGIKLHHGGQYSYDAGIVMVIKAPKGIMVIFKGQYNQLDAKGDAIRAFMKEHRNDT